MHFILAAFPAQQVLEICDNSNKMAVEARCAVADRPHYGHHHGRLTRFIFNIRTRVDGVGGRLFTYMRAQPAECSGGSSSLLGASSESKLPSLRKLSCPFCCIFKISWLGFN